MIGSLTPESRNSNAKIINESPYFSKLLKDIFSFYLTYSFGRLFELRAISPSVVVKWNNIPRNKQINLPVWRGLNQYHASQGDFLTI